MNHPELPALFIGSSVEGLDVAYAIQEGLEYDTEATVWAQGIFRPTQSVLAELLAALDRFVFSVFVFSPDDITKLRGAEHRAVRDNVLFEFGMFVGKRGPEYCFYVIPRGMSDFHLPTDLLGTTALTYQVNRTDGNLVAALGPTCNKIRRTIEVLRGTDERDRPHERLPPESVEVRSQRMLEVWNSSQMQSARQLLRQGINLDNYGRTEKETAALQSVFAFLEAMADKVISGEIAEVPARKEYGKAVLSFWPMAFTALAPPNHADEWWEPQPKIDELYRRWKSG